MAEELSFEVPPAPLPGAPEDLARLIEAMHRSGTLRALAGLFGRLGAVSDVAMTEINSEAGQNIVGSLLFAAQALSKIPADDWAAVARGFDLGVKRAQHRAHYPPPGLFALARRLREPDTRRALDVLVTILGGVGTELRKVSPQPGASS